MLPDFITDLSSISEISLAENIANSLLIPQNICEENNDFELPDVTTTPEEHFHFFDLNLSQQKLNIINELKFSTSVVLGRDKGSIIRGLNYADSDNKIYAEEAADIIYHISSNVETQLKQQLNCHVSCNTELFVQSKRADNELGWHVDGGCRDDACPVKTWRSIIVLRGPSTPFQPISYSQLEDETYNLDWNSDKIMKAMSGKQEVVFNNKAVHGIPPIKKDRLRILCQSVPGF
ncbi:MAG: hypothetical protein HRU36_03855 [Rickettsiales bacterium]|nr:hypothetical protein [Rickettsiales bacterium]